VCTGDEGPEEALATGEPEVAELVLPLRPLPGYCPFPAPPSRDPLLAGWIMYELVGEAQDEGVEQLVMGCISSMRSTDFLRGFSGGMGATP